MINPAELVDRLVSLLREIPELVAEMEGDPERIYAYHDQFPKRSSLAQAIDDMPAPAIMVAWHGTAPGGFGGGDVWLHRLALYLRARETLEGDPPTSYYRLFRLITRGVPLSACVPMLYATVHPDCYPMDVPSIERQTDAEGLDYFEVSVSFREMGDE